MSDITKILLDLSRGTHRNYQISPIQLSDQSDHLKAQTAISERSSAHSDLAMNTKQKNDNGHFAVQSEHCPPTLDSRGTCSWETSLLSTIIH